jgi:SEFIR domain
MSTSNHEALGALLLSLFSAGELRRLLRYGPQGDQIDVALPGSNASPASIAEDAVAQLVKRGLVGDDLFARLVNERPGRAADIERVRVLFALAVAPAPIPPSVPTPTTPIPPSPADHAASTTTPKVFISYAHDSDAHRRRIRALSDQLRTEGVDCEIDQYVAGSPPEGWPLWMERMLDWADYVLVVGSPRYIARYQLREPVGVGKGATWEGAIIRVELYEAQGNNTKFLPVLFEGVVEDVIPKPLRAQTHYRLLGDYDGLYRVLTGQPPVVAPQIGARRLLPPDAS